MVEYKKYPTKFLEKVVMRYPDTAVYRNQWQITGFPDQNNLPSAEY
jgi:hypothetical protein